MWAQKPKQTRDVLIVKILKRGIGTLHMKKHGKKLKIELSTLIFIALAID